MTNAQGNQKYGAQSSGNNNVNWDWETNDWKEAYQAQQMHDMQKEEVNQSDAPKNEPSESSNGRKRTSEKVPLAPAT